MTKLLLRDGQAFVLRDDGGQHFACIADCIAEIQRLQSEQSGKAGGDLITLLRKLVAGMRDQGFNRNQMVRLAIQALESAEARQKLAQQAYADVSLLSSSYERNLHILVGALRAEGYPDSWLKNIFQPSAACPWCGDPLPLQANGTLPFHGTLKGRCEGSEQLPHKRRK